MVKRIENPPLHEDPRLNDILQGIFEGANPKGLSDENKAIYEQYLQWQDAPPVEVPAEVTQEPGPEPEKAKVVPSPRKPKEGSPKSAPAKRAKLANQGPK